MPVKWIFDPLKPSGSRSGGVPSSLVFTPDLDIFVREVLQNSKDQRTCEDPAVVKFSLHQLSGSRKQAFLSTLDWEDLKKHIRGASMKGSEMGRRLYRALNEMERKPLLLLRIEDRNTRGLQGGEDSQGTNFNSLCRNILDTSDVKPGRGGSFGIGKAVLWSFSSISAVLFSSRIDDDPRAGFRFFGRTELPYHEADDKSWDGPGWFGEPKENERGSLAASIWDPEAETISKDLCLYRDLGAGTGTSILVVGFWEPTQDVPRVIEDVAQEILDAAVRWFWPSIYSEKPSLQVYAEAYENGDLIFSEPTRELPEVQPFVQAMLSREEDLVEKVAFPGQVARQTLDFKVPVKLGYRDDPAEPERNAQFGLRVTRGNGGTRMNQVALVRGFGMVVQYRPLPAPLDDMPFYGILMGGLAFGDSEGSKSLEKFLTASEPPSHNRWEVTESLKTNYKQGAGTRFRNLWKSLEKVVTKLCETQSVPEGEGPQRLSRLFPIGGAGGGPLDHQKFRVDRLKANFNNGQWRFSRRVNRRDDIDAPWNFRVFASLDAETGKGAPVKILDLKAENASIRIEEKTAVCEVPAGSNRIDFSGETVFITREETGVDPRRTRMKIEVRPRDGGEQ